jgi:hypothetical protein
MNLREGYFRFTICTLVIVGFLQPSIAQQKNSAALYKRRAETMYANIWKR